MHGELGSQGSFSSCVHSSYDLVDSNSSGRPCTFMHEIQEREATLLNSTSEYFGTKHSQQA